MLNRDSGVFQCSEEQAREIAECAGLTDYSYTVSNTYTLWMDSQTGGGGCRIAWHQGMAWVSVHAGYAGADFSADVRELFVMAGYAQLPTAMHAADPSVFGTMHFAENMVQAARFVADN